MLWCGCRVSFCVGTGRHVWNVNRVCARFLGTIILTPSSMTYRVTSDLSDLLVGHSSWFTYSSMLRIYKLYELNFQVGRVMMMMMMMMMMIMMMMMMMRWLHSTRRHQNRAKVTAGGACRRTFVSVWCIRREPQSPVLTCFPVGNRTPAWLPEGSLDVFLTLALC
jgi:FlaA1/EpsC-like NDP-sugar epimerase